MFVISVLVSLIGCKSGPATLVDADGDGVAASSDCNDDNASIYPGATELCDGIDQDCDGEVDDGLLTTYYRDADADGRGNLNDPLSECVRPVGYVEDNTDCDDSDATVSPDITYELCDDLDHNCDGSTTAGASGGEPFLLDADGDGFGNRSTEQLWCGAPDDGNEWVAFESGVTPTDCNDADPAVNPGADELCATNYDDDCDGIINEDPVDGLSLPIDFDGDGWGSTVVTSCFVGTAVDTDGDGTPDGLTVAEDRGDDCDDTRSSIYPGADELCDGLDNDCDPLTDENLVAIDRGIWWVDSDEDGTGDPADEVSSCDQPAGYVGNNIAPDCNDDDPLIYPGTSEYCDGIDNNCDGQVDDGSAADATDFYLDNDDDGFGDALGTASPSCNDASNPPAGTVANNLDCDDSDPAVGTAGTVYPDADLDGYGDPNSPMPACNPDPATVDNADDCDDNDATVNPDTAWYEDADLDGYGDPNSMLTQCEQPIGYVADDTDCGDDDPEINVDALEDLCDGLDNDCDGDFDEDCLLDHCGTVASPTIWAADRIHVISCDVSVAGAGASLTIEDGAEVRVAPGARLRIGTSQGGALYVQGGPSGVLFRSSDIASPQLWGGIELAGDSAGNYLGNVTIEDAGSRGYAVLVNQSDAYFDGVTILDAAGIGIEATASEVEIADSMISGSLEVGLSLNATSELVALSNTTITGGSAEPIQVSVRYVEELNDGNLFAGNGIDEAILLGDDVLVDTVVAPLDVPYRVEGMVDVAGGSAPELTIESGTEMIFGDGAGIQIGVGAQGSIVVDGTTWDDAGGVQMYGFDATPGDWRGLRIGTGANDSTITGLDIRDGGDNGQGNLWIEGNSGADEDERALVTILDSRSAYSSFSGIKASFGKVVLRDSQFHDNLVHGMVLDRVVFTESDIDGNTFSDNAASGAQVPPNLVELLTGNTYSTNDLPVEITPGTVSDSATWQPLSEPYYMTGQVEVLDADGPELTIADGTSIYFGPNGRFTVGYAQQGSLIIDGTPTTGVLFSSLTDYQGASPIRGSYAGIEIGGNQRVSRISGLTMRYAGSNNGALTFSGDGENPIEINDTVIERSGSTGLYATGPRLNIHDSTFQLNDDEGLFLGTGTRLLNQGGRSFANNVITGNGLHAMTLPADNLGQLDPSSTFAGNNLISGEPDRISIFGDVTSPFQTWSNLDANYWMNSGNIEIGGQNNPVVTIEAGTTFEVEANSSTRLIVATIGNSGGIIANSNGGDPIHFTSDRDWEGLAAPGDWGGIFMGADCLPVDGGRPGASRCILDGVTIDYAGSETEEGALMVQERRTIPYKQEVLMQNLTIRWSGTTGLQFQATGGVLGGTVDVFYVTMPFAWINQSQLSWEDNVHTVACEADPNTSVCDNFDYCYDPISQRWGTNNVFCGNAEANVGARNFRNPFLWVTCADAGASDGPVGTSTCN